MTARLDSDQLGAIAVRLALQLNRWVERRVDTFTFVDDTTVRVSTSVTVRWPDEDFFGGTAAPTAETVVYVPIALLEKRPLTKLDVEREDGSTFAVLATRANGELAAQGLIGAVWGLSERTRDGEGLAAESIEVLESLVTAPLPQAERLLQLLAVGSGSELSDVLRDPDEFRGLTQDLARNFLLLAPAVYRPGTYEVLKYSHTRPLPWTLSVRNVAARFGLADYRTELRRLPLGLSGSYHFQVEAPDEVVLSRARLHGSYVVATDDDSTTRVTVALDEDGDSPVVNLHGRRPSARTLAAAAGFRERRRPFRRSAGRPPQLPDDPLEASKLVRPGEPERADRGFVELRFRSRLAGTFTALVGTSAVATVLLSFARARLGEIDGEAASAILLALPILAAGYLARPGEHAFATRLLVGVRAGALVVGVCSLVIAGVLTGGLVDSQNGSQIVATETRTVVDLAASMAVFTTVVMMIVWLRTWLSPKSPRSRARSARDRTDGRRLMAPLD